MTSRNKLKLQQADDTPEEWIWGNHRGGGGAPLKDVHGNSVANLKTVLRGETEVDYLSPSNSKQKLPNRNNYRDDDSDQYNAPRNNHHNGKPPKNHPRFREEEDDYGGARGVAGRRASGGGGRGYPDDDDYDQRAPRELKLPPKKAQKGGNNARRYDDDDRGGEDFEYDNRGSLGPPQRGGGGADSRRYSDPPRKNNNNYNEYNEEYSNHRSNNNQQPSSNYIPPNPHSPKKFMSALQELQGVTDRERQEKMKKAVEYQNQLKRQIDEKNRKKEIEKQKEEEMKRREYAEYMESISPRNKNNVGAGAGGVGKEKKKVPLFKDERGGGRGDGEDDYPPSHRDRDDDYDHQPPPPRRGNNAPSHHGKAGRSVSSHYDDDRDNDVDDSNSLRGRGGAAGARRNNYDSDPDNHHYQGGSNGRGGGKSSLSPHNGKREKLVSAEEYDELSKLCDKLLSQQETLQSEIRNQAHLIKELQKKGGVANVNTAAKPANPMLRSKSVQQPRPGNQNQQKTPAAPASERGGNDGRSKSNVRPRPSSMYEGSKQLHISGHAGNPTNNKANQNAAKVEPKKASKAAFGHAVINDKVPVGGPKPSAEPQRKPAGAAAAAKDRVPVNAKKGRDNEGGGGVNGFAKLQAKVSNQPLIVSYEEDDGRASKGSLNLELRGQSRYVPVNEASFDEVDDHSYRGGGRGGGDQLDKLLSNTRKGKFM